MILVLEQTFCFNYSAGALKPQIPAAEDGRHYYHPRRAEQRKTGKIDNGGRPVPAQRGGRLQPGSGGVRRQGLASGSKVVDQIISPRGLMAVGPLCGAQFHTSQNEAYPAPVDRAFLRISGHRRFRHTHTVRRFFRTCGSPQLGDLLGGSLVPVDSARRNGGSARGSGAKASPALTERR